MREAAVNQQGVARELATSRHLALGLNEANLIEMYRLMLQARALDERMWILNRQGKVPFVISCRGQEATQVGAGYAFQPGVDFALPYYRDVGLVLAFGMTAHEVMLSLYARAADPNSGGRQMPGHWGHAQRKIISGSSPVATQIPHAAGIALAAKIKREPTVAITTFGEGSTSAGDFHEGLNFAGVHKLPVIFLCENNLYAISVPQAKEMAIQNVADRAASYGFPGVVVDGNDVLAVYEVTKQAVDRARRGEGPTLIEAKTYRLSPHSSDDDDRRYRSPEEVEEWRKRDPLDRCQQYLLAQGILDEERDRQLREEVAREVETAAHAAADSPYPDPEDALKYVYKD
jgi:2-oxoisovalerate dehydrogenase E1 component alpha subunit